ncbi:uncharacterized protein LOC107636633 [Arachis ipaensis]|uniref:uncharacterized protein LOC107636633 n=1 Tax=Arachis ipaensis TaxID=130454 RepID=UPI0007AEF5C3|nr:uncharacterized protein LOC107636633 [Arachis ipaensis]XP_025647757.1 uncharacterized protein LOC112742742 [Arachis hypogaea]
MNGDVAEVTNALANPHLFQEHSFMQSLDLEAMHTPKFFQYMNVAELPVVVDGEFTVGIEFNSRKAVTKAMKDYTIRRGVDYQVYESKPTTFYAKCTQYGTGCDWLIRVTKMQKKYCWEMQRYNGSHTCTRSIISQDHSKLDSKIVAEAIKPFVEVDSSIKVKSVIAEVQSKFNYTVSYRKAWLAKQKAMESIFRGWEASYEALPIWFEAMCHKEPSVVVHFETMPTYQGDDLVRDICVLHRVFWSYYPCIRAFRHYKPVVQVNVTHLYEKYKGCLLVAVSQNGNINIVPIAFAIVEGETSDDLSLIDTILSGQLLLVVMGLGLLLELSICFVSVILSQTSRGSSRHLTCRSLSSILEYQMCYQRLRKQGEAYTYWLDRIPHEQYALAFDGRYRWGHMTTNLVECINSVLKGERNFPVTALVKATFYRLNELFTRKRAEAEARINAGHVFSELLTYADNGATVMNSRLTEFCVDTYLLVVQTSGWIGKCTFMTYPRRTKFEERVAKGWPKMTYFLNEMDTCMLRGPRRCKQCGAEGHNHSRCRQSGGPSAGPAGE